MKKLTVLTLMLLALASGCTKTYYETIAGPDSVQTVKITVITPEPDHWLQDNNPAFVFSVGPLYCGVQEIFPCNPDVVDTTLMLADSTMGGGAASVYSVPVGSRIYATEKTDFPYTSTVTICDSTIATAGLVWQPKYFP